MSSLRNQPYYYTDSCFQVEINLQQTRLDVINMLDDDDDGCLLCDRFKCCCQQESSISDFSANSEVIFERPTYPDFSRMTKMAPPAHSLPLPVWDEQIVPSMNKTDDHKQKDVEAWVKAIKTETVNKENLVPEKGIPNTPKADIIEGSWSSYTPKENIYGAIGEPVPNRNVVDAFFRRFKKDLNPDALRTQTKSNSRLNTTSPLLNSTKSDDLSFLNVTPQSPPLVNSIPPYGVQTRPSVLKNFPSYINYTPLRASLNLPQISTRVHNILPPIATTPPLYPPLPNILPPYHMSMPTSLPNIPPSYVSQNNLTPPLMSLTFAPSFINNTPPPALPLNNFLPNVYL